MNQIMIAAMHSGAGKTVMSCAILAALKKRGLSLCAFKCGPDYIDPMFHSRVLGVPCRNLDLFLQGENGVRDTLSRGEGALALLEGAMGYYDGLNGTDAASAYEIARLTACPVLLTLRPKGSALSLAAQVHGMQSFRPESGIAGLLLTDSTAAMADFLRPVLERETGLPVLGSLPPMPEAEKTRLPASMARSTTRRLLSAWSKHSSQKSAQATTPSAASSVMRSRRTQASIDGLRRRRCAARASALGLPTSLGK